MSIMLAGFFLGLSLIIAVGPQNILLIKQGIRREGITAVIIVCVLSDIVLITGGIAGVGILVEKAPLVLEVLRWGGAVYLLWFAWRTFKDALHPGSVTVVDEAPTGQPEGTGGGSAVLTKTRLRQRTHATQRPVWFKPMLMAIALTWLNPAAYVDVVVMVGGIANQYGEEGRWFFSLGALGATFLWFPLVGYGAGLLRKPLSKPEVWRWLNFIITGVLVALALKLILM